MSDVVVAIADEHRKAKIIVETNKTRNVFECISQMTSLRFKTSNLYGSRSSNDCSFYFLIRWYFRV